MECLCGCGTKIRKKDRDAAIQAGPIALELLVWDKARTLWRLSPVDSKRVDEATALIDQGADLYQALLRRIHDDWGGYSLEEADAWLAKAERERRDHSTMTKSRWFSMSRSEPLLSADDIALLDRVHPERSYSRTGEGDAREAGDS